MTFYLVSVNIGASGASRQSWTHDDTLRQKLLSLIIEHPSAKNDEIRDLHWRWVEDNPGLCALVHRYWFDNHVRYLRRDYPSEAKRRYELSSFKKKRYETYESDKSAIRQKIIDAAPKIALLGMIMPNGKPLAECTGKECEDMGPRIGGWLMRISVEVGPDKMVGDVLSEDRVKTLYSNN